LPPGANPKTFITSSGNLTKKQEPDTQLTVNGVADQFIEWATSYYVKDSNPTNQVLLIRLAIKILRELYGREPASTFGPLALKACRDQFIKQGLARTECNRRTRLIVQAFRWAVENELIPAVNLEALRAVKGLPKGRSAAHESEPVRPVPDTHVDAILAHLSGQVRAMVELERLTGMRPNEVVQMTTGDLSMSGQCWEYTPQHHKTEHHETGRVVMIGPRAQEILKPWLRPALKEPLFQPRETMMFLNEERRAERKTKLWPSHLKHQASKRKPDPKRVPADRYSVNAHRRAIHRACDKAGVTRWSPNRLRHLASTKLRRQTGDLDAVRCVLGHSDTDTSAIYAEKDLQAARAVMLKFG
jgi:integrase